VAKHTTRARRPVRLADEMLTSWRQSERLTKGDAVFLILFFVLLVLWVLGFLAFHVAGGLIHLLLIVAVISLVLHLVRGPRAA
jgi:hypothetical protein